MYDLLSSPEYNNKMNDVASQLIEPAKDLKVEIKSHKDRWDRRYSVHSKTYADVGTVDFKLKGLVHARLSDEQSQLFPLKRSYINIEELS